MTGWDWVVLAYGLFTFHLGWFGAKYSYKRKWGVKA